MELNNDEQRRGMIWFFGAGLFSLALTIILAKVDLTLTYSDTRAREGRELHAVRIASTSLSSGAVDPRMQTPKGALRKVEKSADGHDHHDHGHGEHDHHEGHHGDHH